MSTEHSINNLLWIRRVVAHVLVVAMVVTTVWPASIVHAVQPATISHLPVPGTMVSVSPGYQPMALTGVRIYPANPLQFDFIIDPGDSQLDDQATQSASERLIKYFLTALTIPKNDVWVNLSPHQQDRVIPEHLAHTDMGRDMLSQDYLLKQLSASMLYPERDLGAAFWENIRRRAYQQFGSTDIPVRTFNKVWIVPDKAVVYEQQDAAFVVESRLRVMLESDYQAYLSSRNVSDAAGSSDQSTEQQIDQLTSDMIRDLIIPEIEKEINEGRQFAALRQIYQSMILATWYRRNLTQTLLSQLYVGQSKIAGVDIAEKDIKDKIYQQYLKAFKAGVYNYIREDIDPATRQVVPRQYVSGGLTMDVDKVFRTFNDVDTARQLNARLTDADQALLSARVVLNPEGQGSVQDLSAQLDDWLERLKSSTTDASMTADPDAPARLLAGEVISISAADIPLRAEAIAEVIEMYEADHEDELAAEDVTEEQIYAVTYRRLNSRAVQGLEAFLNQAVRLHREARPLSILFEGENFLHLAELIDNATDALRQRYQQNIRRAEIRFEILEYDRHIELQILDNGIGWTETGSKDFLSLGGLGTALHEAKKTFWEQNIDLNVSPRRDQQGAAVAIRIPKSDISIEDLFGAESAAAYFDLTTNPLAQMAPSAILVHPYISDSIYVDKMKGFDRALILFNKNYPSTPRLAAIDNVKTLVSRDGRYNSAVDMGDRVVFLGGHCRQCLSQAILQTAERAFKSGDEFRAILPTDGIYTTADLVSVGEQDPERAVLLEDVLSGLTPMDGSRFAYLTKEIKSSLMAAYAKDGLDQLSIIVESDGQREFVVEAGRERRRLILEFVGPQDRAMLVPDKGYGFKRGPLKANLKPYAQQLRVTFDRLSFGFLTAGELDALVNAVMKIRADSMAARPEFFGALPHRLTDQTARETFMSRILQQRTLYQERTNTDGSRMFSETDIHGMLFQKLIPISWLDQLMTDGLNRSQAMTIVTGWSDPLGVWTTEFKPLVEEFVSQGLSRTEAVSIILQWKNPKARWEKYLKPVRDELVRDGLSPTTATRVVIRWTNPDQKWSQELKPIRGQLIDRGMSLGDATDAVISWSYPLERYDAVQQSIALLAADSVILTGRIREIFWEHNYQGVLERLIQQPGVSRSKALDYAQPIKDFEERYLADRAMLFDAETEAKLDAPLSENLYFSERLQTVFRRNGLITHRDLTSMTAIEFTRLPEIGDILSVEAEQTLEQDGLTFGMTKSGLRVWLPTLYQTLRSDPVLGTKKRLMIILEDRGIEKFGDLVKYSYSDLVNMPGINWSSAMILEQRLQAHGLTLGVGKWVRKLQSLEDRAMLSDVPSLKFVKLVLPELNRQVNMSAIGRRVRTFRTDRSETQTQTSQRSGVKYATYLTLERGARADTDLKNMILLRNHFGTSLSVLVDGQASAFDTSGPILFDAIAPVVANNLVLLRTAMGLTLKELAAHVGMSSEYLVRIESGDLGEMTLQNIVSLSETFGIHPEVFISRKLELADMIEIISDTDQFRQLPETLDASRRREIGSRIAILRRLRQLTQEDVAVRLGITPDQLGKLENGRLQQLNVEFFVKLQSILDASVYFLLTGKENGHSRVELDVERVRQDFGENLIVLQEFFGMTYKTFAEKLGIPTRTLTTLKNGGLYQLEHINRVARRTRVPIHILLGSSAAFRDYLDGHSQRVLNANVPEQLDAEQVRRSLRLHLEAQGRSDQELLDYVSQYHTNDLTKFLSGKSQTVSLKTLLLAANFLGTNFLNVLTGSLWNGNVELETPAYMVSRMDRELYRAMQSIIHEQGRTDTVSSSAGLPSINVFLEFIHATDSSVEEVLRQAERDPVQDLLMNWGRVRKNSLEDAAMISTTLRARNARLREEYALQRLYQPSDRIEIVQAEYFSAFFRQNDIDIAAFARRADVPEWMVYDLLEGRELELAESIRVLKALYEVATLQEALEMHAFTYRYWQEHRGEADQQPLLNAQLIRERHNARTESSAYSPSPEALEVLMVHDIREAYTGTGSRRLNLTRFLSSADLSRGHLKYNFPMPDGSMLKRQLSMRVGTALDHVEMIIHKKADKMSGVSFLGYKLSSEGQYRRHRVSYFEYVNGIFEHQRATPEFVRQDRAMMSVPEFLFDADQLQYLGLPMPEFLRRAEVHERVKSMVEEAVDYTADDPALARRNREHARRSMPGIIIDLRNFDLPYSHLEVHDYEDGFMFFIPEGDRMLIHPYIDDVIELLGLLNGDEVEGEYPQASENDRLEPGYWNQWQRSSDWKTYVDEIHPTVASAVSHVLDRIKSQDKQIRVVDIFAGEGNFVQHLSGVLKQAHEDVNVAYEVIEGNPSNYRRALDRLSSNGNVTVHPPTDMLDITSLKDILRGSPDIVTALGGLNVSVISREDARKVAQMVFDVLRPGGFFVVSGLTPSLLHADDFRAMGYRIYNQTIPQNFYSRYQPVEVYILQKDAAMLGDTEADKHLKYLIQMIAGELGEDYVEAEEDEDLEGMARDRLMELSLQQRADFYALRGADVFGELIRRPLGSHRDDFDAELGMYTNLRLLGEMLGMTEGFVDFGNTMDPLQLPRLQERVEPWRELVRYVASAEDYATIRREIQQLAGMIDAPRVNEILQRSGLSRYEPEFWFVHLKSIGRMDDVWFDHFHKLAELFYKAFGATFDIGTETEEHTAGPDIFERVIELIVRSTKADPADLETFFADENPDVIALLYVITYGKAPDIHAVRFLYHGSPLVNIDQMIYDSDGMVDFRRGERKLDTNYLSFNPDVSQSYAQDDGLILEFDVAALLALPNKYILGPEIESEEITTTDPIPFTALTTRSKLEVAVKFWKDDAELDLALARALGFLSIVELQKFMRSADPAMLAPLEGDDDDYVENARALEAAIFENHFVSGVEYTALQEFWQESLEFFDESRADYVSERRRVYMDGQQNGEFTVVSRQQGDQAIADALRRAALWHRLNQRNVAGIPRLLSMGLTEDGYMWMRLRGIANAVRLDEADWLTWSDRLSVVEQLLDTLKQMHDVNISHGDIYDGNVLVNRQGQVMLIDIEDGQFDASGADIKKDLQNVIALLQDVLDIDWLTSVSEQDLIDSGLQELLTLLRQRDDKISTAVNLWRSVRAVNEYFTGRSDTPAADRAALAGDQQMSGLNFDPSIQRFVRAMDGRRVRDEYGREYELVLDVVDPRHRVVDVHLQTSTGQQTAKYVMKFVVTDKGVRSGGLDLQRVSFDGGVGGTHMDLSDIGLGRAIFKLFVDGLSGGEKVFDSVYNIQTLETLASDYYLDDSGRVRRVFDDHLVIDTFDDGVPEGQIGLSTVWGQTLLGRMFRSTGLTLSELSIHNGERTLKNLEALRFMLRHSASGFAPIFDITLTKTSNEEADQKQAGRELYLEWMQRPVDGRLAAERYVEGLRNIGEMFVSMPRYSKLPNIFGPWIADYFKPESVEAQYRVVQHFNDKLLQSGGLDPLTPRGFENALLELHSRLGAVNDDISIAGRIHDDQKYARFREAIERMFTPAFAAIINSGDPDAVFEEASRVFVEIWSSQVFQNGNHRMASFVMNYILIRAGYQPFYLDLVNASGYINILDNEQIQSAGEYEDELLAEMQEEFAALLKFTILKQLPDDSRTEADEAMTSQDPVGGINFDADLIDLEIRGDHAPIELPFNPDQLQQLRIDGFSPVIIQIAPVTNLPLLLGLRPDGPDSESDRSTAQMVQGPVQPFADPRRYETDSVAKK